MLGALQPELVFKSPVDLFDNEWKLSVMKLRACVGAHPNTPLSLLYFRLLHRCDIVQSSTACWTFLVKSCFPVNLRSASDLHGQFPFGQAGSRINQSDTTQINYKLALKGGFNIAV